MNSATRRSRTRWPLVLAVVGLVLVMVAGLGAVAANLLLQRYESTVQREVLLDPSAREPGQQDQPTALRRALGVPGEPLNFLLVGSDWRAEFPEEGQRSDSIIIVQVNASRDHAFLISIPRDLLVEIPPFPKTGFYGSEQKINAAFHFGGGGATGMQLLSATLTRLTGVTFDGAAVINFDGFSDVIDILGGIEICLDVEVSSIHTDRHFASGCHSLDGSAALDLSRQRYGLENGDYDRQKHHQYLLKAMFQRALEQGIAANPMKLDQLIRAIGSALTLDTGGAGLTELVFALRNLRPGALTGITVPSYPQWLGNESYILLDYQADGLFTAIDNAVLPAWASENPYWVNSL